ncbi:MAG TPA: hypothetical protein VFE67_19325 [Rudaea sp.]|jgi:hypothetical protein|nr:hypothetical protein [Rudaea sp.]
MSRLHTIALVLMLFVPGAFLASARAQSSGGAYVIDPAADAGGAAALSGGPFRLSATVGQPATALLVASGYRLEGGFHPTLSDRIFSSGFDQ